LKADDYRLGFLMLGVVTSYVPLVLGAAWLGGKLDPRWGTAAGFAVGIAACVIETWAALKLWSRKEN
jgi:hypothetical protein